MINWFPGHMNKTLKQMQSDSKLCDCFIYVLDARCPVSCINPEFVQVVKSKPIIFVLNKADLVDKTTIELYKQHFTSHNFGFVSLNSTVSGAGKILINELKNVFAERLKANKDKGVNFVLRAMVIGVPNSGKSTIVNNLCGSGRAVTGNKAGVTKSKQWVKVAPCIEVLDTPGIMLPNSKDEDRLYNLAFVGSVRDDVLNLEDIAGKLITQLLNVNADVFKSTYGVDINRNTPNMEALAQIGKKRGCLIKGGEIDYDRSAKLLLTDFRSGKLGKICLDKI